ncbi:MAG: serine/threonine protein kinase, partial [Myxococcales bacterium]|nr:serine/threonine protein kinase [Myxococcales bacterium]
MFPPDQTAELSTPAGRKPPRADLATAAESMPEGRSEYTPPTKVGVWEEGSVINDRYTLERRLGSGSMGEVFLANDLENDRQVAVKILQSQYSASAESRDRFLREMKICASLEHPHIIRLHDYGESDGTLYFVMDLVEGRSLKEVVAEGPMDVHDAVDIAEAVADALAYIHPRDLIHRDLKPA